MNESTELNPKELPFAYELIDIASEIGFAHLDIARQAGIDTEELNKEILSFIEEVGHGNKDNILKSVLDWSNKNVMYTPSSLLARIIGASNPFFAEKLFDEDELRLMLDHALECEINYMESLISETELRKFYRTNLQQPNEDEKKNPLSKVAQKRDLQQKLRKRVGIPTANLPRI